MTLFSHEEKQNLFFKEPGTMSTTKFQNQVTGNVERRGILDIYIMLENKHASFLPKGFIMQRTNETLCRAHSKYKDSVVLLGNKEVKCHINATRRFSSVLEVDANDFPSVLLFRFLVLWLHTAHGNSHGVHRTKASIS